MVIDSISPTFSIPSASTFFEISTDNGITYTDANVIEVNYYALNKMTNFTGDTNPLNLLFRKKSDIVDEQDYRIYKILVNNASTFLPDPNTGLNVESTSTQDAHPPYLAGRYATYNSVTTGGLNFSDFKIQSIDNTAMQIVFFVSPIGGISVTFVASEASNDNFKVVCKFKNNTGGEKTVHVGDTLNFITYVEFSLSGGWELEESGSYSFQYGITANDVLNFSENPAYPTYTSEYNWNLTIDEIIWNATPTITIAPTKFTAYLKKTWDTYWVFGIDNFSVFQLNNGSWTNLNKTVLTMKNENKITPYDDTTYAVYQDAGMWRFKTPNNGDPNHWSATSYGIDSLPSGKNGPFVTKKTAKYP